MNTLRAMRVIVIGAGVVGLTTAWLLQLEGLAVSVIDRDSAAGAGASAGNGAQLSYAHVAPLADPSVLRKLPQLLLAADAPLAARVQLDPAQWRWAWAFLRACTRAQAQRASAALLQLGALSRGLTEELIEREQIDCNFTRGGKLVVYPDAASLAAARAQMLLQRTLGCDQQLLERAECVAREPALAGYAAHIAGGVWTPGEAAADSAAFCTQLAARLRAQGVVFHFGRTVTALAADKGGVRVATEQGALTADCAVLASGSHAATLARTARLRVPVYPLKGYSITLDRSQQLASARLRCSITDARRKVVFAPLGDSVRVAGFVELVGHDTLLPAARIGALKAAAREVIGLDAAGDVRPWCGFRPATPSGLPLLGATPRKTLFLNVGHGTLGWTLAAGSARVVVNAIVGRAPGIDVRPFAWR